MMFFIFILMGSKSVLFVLFMFWSILFLRVDCILKSWLLFIRFMLNVVVLFFFGKKILMVIINLFGKWYWFIVLRFIFMLLLRNWVVKFIGKLILALVKVIWLLIFGGRNLLLRWKCIIVLESLNLVNGSWLIIVKVLALWLGCILFFVLIILFIWILCGKGRKILMV